MIKSPFYKLSKQTEKKLAIVLLILLPIFIAIMRFFDSPLRNDVAPNGIVSFELAKQLPVSESIINSWDTQARTSAGMSMGLDFLFLIIYASFIALLMHKLNERVWKNTRIYKFGILLIWGVFFAAIFDAIENVALIKLLLGDLRQSFTSIAFYFASMKFVLLILGVLFIVISWIVKIVRKRASFKTLSLFLLVFLVSCKSGNKKSLSEIVDCQSATKTVLTESKEDGVFKAHKSKTSIIIDGCSNDKIWSKYTWYSMNYNWMGSSIDSTDYQGRFKLAWDAEKLYILVEVIDDHLNPTLSDGKDNYWKGDYVEVFIDEDISGGDHKFNHQAFAYHVSTEGHAVDKNTLQETVFFDDHIEVERTQDGDRHLWEMAIKLYDKNFDENSSDNIPVKILNQKSIGFSIAYGDNDGNNNRENFIGSKKTHGNNNDEGYVNSDVFGSILFEE